MTSTHRYPRSALMAEYTRGGIGLAVTGLPIVSTPLATTMLVIFGALAALFGVYVLRTWIRGSQAIEIDGVGIRRTGPLPIAIPWDDLRGMDVRYFSTRRDREGGWMELKLLAPGRKLAIESSIEDFDALARHCTLVARRNGLELSPTTQDNLRALGLIEPAPGGDGPDKRPVDPREGG